MTDILLATLQDPERIKFEVITVVSGQVRRRGISLRLHRRLFRMVKKEPGAPVFDVIVAGLVVCAGEMGQRQLIERVLSPKVRDIRVRPEKTHVYLFNILGYQIKGKEKKEMLNQLESVVEQALKAFKREAGLPEISPQEFCHTLTEEVIEAAESEVCRKYLEINARSCPHILSGELKEFTAILSTKFPQEADAVERALQASRTRNHLAAISLEGEGDKLKITLVNSAGIRITMKAWRFLQLTVDPGNSIKLGEFPDARRYVEPEIIFNNQRKGVVHGLFSPQHASLEIICIDPDKSGANALLDRSILAIDLDYALLVALVLKHLQQDQERVSCLMQKLLTNAVDDRHRQLFTLNEGE